MGVVRIAQLPHPNLLTPRTCLEGVERGDAKITKRFIGACQQPIKQQLI